MLRRSKRLIVASAVATGVLTVVPAPHATSMAPCQGRSLFGVTEWTQTVAVAGAYTSAGATDVWLTCGIVRNGVTVKRFSENIPGPVAAVAGTAEVSAGAFSTCYELYVTYLDRAPTSSDTCP